MSLCAKWFARLSRIGDSLRFPNRKGWWACEFATSLKPPVLAFRMRALKDLKSTIFV